MPRIRSKDDEIHWFIDHFVHYSEDLVQQVILGRSFLLSGRKFSLWLSRIIDDHISYPTLYKLSTNLGEEFVQFRQRALPSCQEALILDGLWFKQHGFGKRVLLTALGVDKTDKVQVLDWVLAKSEGYPARTRLNLLKRLREHGLGSIRLIVSNGSLGLL